MEALNVFEELNIICSQFNAEFAKILYDGNVVWSLKRLFNFYEEIRGLEQAHSQMNFTFTHSLTENCLSPHLHQFKQVRAPNLAIGMKKALDFLLKFNEERKKVSDFNIHHEDYTKDGLKKLLLDEKSNWKSYTRFLVKKMKKLEEQLNAWLMCFTDQFESNELNSIIISRCKGLNMLYSERFTVESFLKERYRQYRLGYELSEGNGKIISKCLKFFDMSYPANDEEKKIFAQLTVNHLIDMNVVFKDDDLLTVIDVIEKKINCYRTTRNSTMKKIKVKYPITSMGYSSVNQTAFKLDLRKQKLILELKEDHKLTILLSTVSEVTLNVKGLDEASHFCFAEPVKADRIKLRAKFLPENQPEVATFLKNGGFVYIDQHQQIKQINALTEGNYWCFEGPYFLKGGYERFQKHFYQLPKDVFGKSPLKRSIWLPPSEFSLKDNGAFLCQLKLRKTFSHEGWKLVFDPNSTRQKFKAEQQGNTNTYSFEFIEKALNDKFKFLDKS